MLAHSWWWLASAIAAGYVVGALVLAVVLKLLRAIIP